MPLYYLEVRGQSLIATGLLTGPQGLGAMVAMPVANRLTERFGGGRVTLAGVSVLCLSTIPLVFLNATTSIVGISLVLAVRGVSIGLCFMPAMTAAFGALRPEQISDATPQLNVLQRVGGAVGTSVLAVVLARASVGAHTSAQLASAFGQAYWWGLGIAALAFIPAIMLLRAERPRATQVGAAAEPATTEPAPAEPAVANPSAVEPIGV